MSNSMDLKALRRQCRYAMHELITLHGYGLKDFTPADGDEAIYSPTNLQRRFSARGFMTQVPKGAMLLWRSTSWEDPREGDYHLPTEILDEIKFWSAFDANHNIEIFVDDLAS